jgi:hypothetical protein
MICVRARVYQVATDSSNPSAANRQTSEREKSSVPSRRLTAAQQLIRLRLDPRYLFIA